MSKESNEDKFNKVEEFIEQVEGNPVPLNQKLTNIDLKINDNEKKIIKLNTDMKWLKNKTKSIDTKLWGLLLTTMGIIVGAVINLFL